MPCAVPGSRRNLLPRVRDHPARIPANLASTAAAVVEAWSSARVVTIRPSVQLADVRATYDALLPLIGTPHYLAEDSRIADRHSQGTGELWFAVCYDPAIRDSYRNSSNAAAAAHRRLVHPDVSERVAHVLRGERRQRRRDRVHQRGGARGGARDRATRSARRAATGPDAARAQRSPDAPLGLR